MSDGVIDMGFMNDIDRFQSADRELRDKKGELTNAKNLLHSHAKEIVLERIGKCDWVAKRNEKEAIGYYLMTDNTDFVVFMNEMEELGAFGGKQNLEFSFGRVSVREDKVIIQPSPQNIRELDQYLVKVDTNDITLAIKVIRDKIDYVQNEIDEIKDILDTEQKKKKEKRSPEKKNG